MTRLVAVLPALILVAATYGPAAPNRDRPAVLGWLRQEDYPADSLAARESGEVTAAFDVTEAGAAMNCRVVRSSGYLRLDDATCALIEQRTRFRPAADAAGRPIASRDVRAFRWVLPPKGLNALGIVTDGGSAR
ncbi:MAG: energy transducer TonB [Sphingomonas sp.]